MHKLFMLVLLSITFIGSAQVVEILDAEKVSNSSVIVEGKVVGKQVYQNKLNNRNYTNNRIKIYKIFKGENVSDTIDIITEGGSLNNVETSVSEGLQLQPNQLGLFFLQQAKENLQLPASKKTFVVYGSSQGIYFYDIKQNKASSIFNSFNSIRKLYRHIYKLTHVKYKVVDKSFVAPKKCFL